MRLSDIQNNYKSVRKEIILMKCPNCGAENAENINFCVTCGSPLTNEQQGQSPAKNLPFDVDKVKKKILPIVKNKFVLLGAAAVVLVIILISVISAIAGSDNGYIEVERVLIYYGSDEKIYISSDNKLLKTTIPGTVADFGTSIDDKYAYVVNDEGDLYVVNGSKVQKVAGDVVDVELAVTGKGLLYTVVSEEEDGEIELFHYVLGKKSVSVFDGDVESYVISPDGKTAAYTVREEADEDDEDDDGKMLTYFFDGKKSTKISSSDLSLHGLSNSGKYIYTAQKNDEGGYILYSLNKKGEKTKLGNAASSNSYDFWGELVESGPSLYFNADHTQVLFYNDGKTYVSEKGKAADGSVKNKELTLVLTEEAYRFDNTYPVDNLYDHVYRSGDDVWFIRKNSDKSVKLISKASYLTLDSTASYLYYVYDNDELRVIKISDGEKATDKAKTIVDENVSMYVVTSDRDLVYYVYDKELYSANGKKGKNVKHISSDELSDSYLCLSENDTVFYNIDGDLYACSNGKKGTKVLSETELGYSINGIVFAYQDDVVWTTKAKKFKKLITIEE